MTMLLPYRPKPKPDELLSSWLIRLANGYRMELSEFLDMLCLTSHIHACDVDRLAPEILLIRLSELTGTTIEAARRTLLQSRFGILRTDRLHIQSVAWPWQIPIGHSRHHGRTCGFQICPRCLAEGETYFRWQSQVALFCCCEVHGCLLIDQCPRCLASIHAAPHGLLAIRRARTENALIELERCTQCRFDFRRAGSSSAPQKLLAQQVAYYDLLRSAENGTDSAEHFTILRHLITLLYGENRGLEGLRRVVSSHSGTERVDIPIPYESDEDVVSFEEANVVTRSRSYRPQLGCSKTGQFGSWSPAGRLASSIPH